MWKSNVRWFNWYQYPVFYKTELFLIKETLVMFLFKILLFFYDGFVVMSNWIPSWKINNSKYGKNHSTEFYICDLLSVIWCAY